MTELQCPRNQGALLGWSVLGALLLTAELALAGAELSVGVTNGTPGQTVLVPINFASSDAAVAVQLEVRFDGAKLVSGAATGGNALNQHLVASAAPANGTRRLVIYSLSNSPLKNGVLVNLPFTILSTAAEGVASISITNALLVNTNGAQIAPVNLTSGSLAIIRSTPAMPARLGSLVRARDGRVQLQLIGTAGRSYVIQASTNLVQWIPLSTNAVAGGSVDFVDTTAVDLKQRFYRAILAP